MCSLIIEEHSQLANRTKAHYLRAERGMLLASPVRENKQTKSTTYMLLHSLEYSVN